MRTTAAGCAGEQLLPAWSAAEETDKSTGAELANVTTAIGSWLVLCCQQAAEGCSRLNGGEAAEVGLKAWPKEASTRHCQLQFSRQSAGVNWPEVQARIGRRSLLSLARLWAVERRRGPGHLGCTAAGKGARARGARERQDEGSRWQGEEKVGEGGDAACREMERGETKGVWSVHTHRQDTGEQPGGATAADWVVYWPSRCRLVGAECAVQQGRQSGSWRGRGVGEEWDSALHARAAVGRNGVAPPPRSLPLCAASPHATLPPLPRPLASLVAVGGCCLSPRARPRVGSLHCNSAVLSPSLLCCRPVLIPSFNFLAPLHHSDALSEPPSRLLPAHQRGHTPHPTPTPCPHRLTPHSLAISSPSLYPILLLLHHPHHHAASTCLLFPCRRGGR